LSKPFTFKQFTISQDRCAMKVGTDGVLLGAWTSLIQEPNSILDIGTGTGLIALQLAQRSTAETIDAIEINAAAYEQCVNNFEASPWGDRLFCYHASWNEFVSEIDDEYELIVANPPFHEETVSSGEISRDQARQSDALPFIDLICGVEKLLASDGIFTTIIPYKATEKLITLAASYGLFPHKITHVKGNPEADIKRNLLEFHRFAGKVVTNELIIETHRHHYAEAYITLTKDFYLKM